jgi:hypothetical protein
MLLNCQGPNDHTGKYNYFKTYIYIICTNSIFYFRLSLEGD